MDMRSPDRPFEHGPEGFERVDVGISVRPILGAVIDRVVVIAERPKNAIRRPFVGTDTRSRGNLARNFRDQGSALRVGDDLGVHFAVALQDTEHNRLARRAASPFAGSLAADIRLIDFNMAGQGRLAVQVAHVFPDLVRHAEGGRVRDAQLALQLLRRDAMPCRGEQVHRVEPLLQRNMGAVKHVTVSIEPIVNHNFAEEPTA